MKPITSWVEATLPIAKLKAFKGNPRIMREKQAELLKLSLEEFGQAELILLNKDHTVIAGHQRIRTLAGMGVTEANVRISTEQLTDQDFRELNIRDNLNVGAFDFEALRGDFTEQELSIAGFEFSIANPDAPIEGNEERDAEDPVGEAKDVFDKGETKQIVVIIFADQYADLMSKIETLRAAFQVERAAEVVEQLIEDDYRTL